MSNIFFYQGIHVMLFYYISWLDSGDSSNPSHWRMNACVRRAYGEFVALAAAALDPESAGLAAADPATGMANLARATS